MTTRRFKSFLVAVREIDRLPRALLSKSARLAQHFDASLELLHVIALPYLVPGNGESTESAKDAEIARQRTKLERAARRLRNAGIEVTCTVVWDYPASDAIVRQVARSKPDVVIAESHHHGKLARWFVAHTDWELIRSCPCPLWLVKSARSNASLRVLAAIDPFHTHSKPAALDEELLRVAKLASGERGKLGVTHVYAAPISMLAGGMGEPVWTPAPPSEQRRVKQRVMHAVNDVADRYDISKNDRVVATGDAGTELPNVAKRWKGNLLVMGAVSRSGLKRAFLGHTAERVIDAVDCDVLIVKPRAFKTTVSSRQYVPVLPMPPI